MAAGAFDSFSHMMETYFSEPDGQNVSDEIAEALMRSVIKNIRQAVRDPRDYTARSNLLWASTLSENRLIKLGKKCDFTCHLIEHQLSAYTDCSHSQGMAVLHPAYYRHIYRDGLAKFARFARHVWMMPGEGRTEEELAEAGIDALADFIRETALPTSLREMGIKTRDSLRRSRIPAIIRRGHTGSSAPGRAWDSSGNVSDTGIQTRIDEIYLWTEEFRVFQNMHPDIRLIVINANAAAQGMIRHVKRERKSES